ncbi:MAG: hypothetical protein JWP16_1792 [Alphaproteobacteria bacterium]|nr:hypothetical protein [Alphaproteobacteria bacterium]MDB5740752.1 hypothetical protein [Alphaproteobacteria bacterium]
MARSSKDTQEEPPVLRRGRIRPVGADAGIAATAFARAGFSDPTLVLRWNEIAGPEMARLCQPLKFSEGPSGGTLTLRAAPGAALFLGHEKRAICERINRYLGRPAVAQVKFSQGAPLTPRPPTPRQKPAGPLPPADPSRRYDGPEGLAKALQALARRR